MDKQAALVALAEAKKLVAALEAYGKAYDGRDAIGADFHERRADIVMANLNELLGK